MDRKKSLNKWQISETKSCELNGHDLQISHICVFKQCGDNRIGCIKCLEVHDHQQPTQSHYLKLKQFKYYIQEIVVIKLSNYNYNEEVIRELSKINSKTRLVTQTIESLQITQMMHLDHFKLAENRWKAPFLLSQQVLNQLVNMDDDSITKQYQKNSELLSLLEKSGTYIDLEPKIQQFVMEEKYLKNQKFYIFQESNFHNLKISPNSAYLAYEIRNQLQIFKISSNKMIVNKSINYHNFDISFTNDSQFYLYYDDRFIYFQALRNYQKRIFGRFEIQVSKILPLNLQEVLISDKDNYLVIINIQSRSKRKFLTEKDWFIRRIIGIDYDNKNCVIVCGKEDEIVFYNQHPIQLLFKKHIHKNDSDIQQIKLLRKNNYLICGFEKMHYLYMINYQKKDLLLLNKFTSRCRQSVCNIFHQRYPIIINESGVIILDENFNILQFIELTETFPELLIGRKYQVLMCKKNKIQLIKSCKSIDYTQKARNQIEWYI